MGSGVVVGHHPVAGGGHDLPILDDHRPEGTSALRDVALGDLYGHAHVLVVVLRDGCLPVSDGGGTIQSGKFWKIGIPACGLAGHVGVLVCSCFIFMFFQNLDNVVIAHNFEVVGIGDLEVDGFSNDDMDRDVGMEVFHEAAFVGGGDAALLP